MWHQRCQLRYPTMGRVQNPWSSIEISLMILNRVLRIALRQFSSWAELLNNIYKTGFGCGWMELQETGSGWGWRDFKLGTDKMTWCIRVVSMMPPHLSWAELSWAAEPVDSEALGLGDVYMNYVYNMIIVLLCVASTWRTFAKLRYPWRNDDSFIQLQRTLGHT